MRALSRSYGDISILTRSPTVKRTKRLRILPQMVASTRCLLSSATRNMVPGRTVLTLPSISMCCSFMAVENVKGGVRFTRTPPEILIRRLLAALSGPAVSAAARAFFARPGRVDGNDAAAQFRPVQGGDGFLRLLAGAHGHKTKAARAAGGAIHHQVGFGDGTVRGESIVQVVLGDAEGKIAHK